MAKPINRLRLVYCSPLDSTQISPLRFGVVTHIGQNLLTFNPAPGFSLSGHTIIFEGIASQFGND